ncbi:hypothetical protein MASR2M15_30000 [Anaerolineales bacterium]
MILPWLKCPCLEIQIVIDLWAQQTADLGQTYQWVQVFENRGEQMGSSNPHPHGQVWAQNTLPTLIAKEDRNQQVYFNQHGQPLLLDYLKLELEQQRILIENEDWWRWFLFGQSGLLKP